jgi:ATP-dependent exoDNAse (exonuclease V) beta subunit
MTPRLVDEALDGALRVGRRLAGKDADVALLMAHLGERRLREGLAALLDRRLVTKRALHRFLSSRPGPSPEAAFGEAFSRLRGVMAAPPADLVGFLADGPVEHPAYALVRADLACLSAGVVSAPRAWLDRVSRYFLSKNGTPRTRLAPPFRKDDCPNPAAYKRHVQAMAAFAPYVESALQAFDRDLNLAMARGVARLFRVARWRYRHALETEAAVDFSDGLARALALLRRMDEFAQSRYRLEARYHHVLVDEFQDTSRAQWRLVARLIESWGEGMGLAQDAPLQPSIFVVGDRKQSIYAFRDANVRMLALARRHVRGLRPSGDARRTISRSFRSAPALLSFTNDLFSQVPAVARPDAFRYGPGDRFPVHLSTTPACDAPEALGLVVGATAEQAAAALADEVARLLSSATVRDRRTGLPRQAMPGDIAILFRSRESHRVFEAALDARGVRTYVYKGLGFFDADEVKDMLALLRYLAEPASDLRAAALLRSRLVRLSDQALQRLSPAFAEALAGSDDRVAERLDEEDAGVLRQVRLALASWLPLVDRVPPAEVLDRVLEDCAYAFELRGPRLLQARENLKKVRALTRRVQNIGYCTLGRVAEHLERLSGGDESNAVIDAADAVNLMTVHAAKGLEFPIVFVVNLTRGTGGGADPILVLDGGNREGPLVSVGGQLADATESVRARDLEETKRLLYVAVTRARERLYLSAVLKNGLFAAASGSLGEVMPASMATLFRDASTAKPGDVLTWRGGDGAQHAFRICVAETAEETRPHVVDVGLPGDTTTSSVERDHRVLPDPEGEHRVSVTAYVAGVPDGPSRLDGARDVDEGPHAAQLVGTLVHRLFQALGTETASTDTLEARARALLSAAERDEVPVATFAALQAREEWRDLVSGGDCLYEVPFSMRMGNGAREPNGCRIVVRGSIDCLVRRPDGSVTVVEIKTGRPQAWHQHQLQVYVDAAAALCPGVPVEGRILYAVGPGATACNRLAGPGV